MPVVPMQQILGTAFRSRYGVAAFNVFSELSMRAVLDGAAQSRSPVIVQVSVKTVHQLGAKLLQQMFADLAGRVPVPATLHLDHCPERPLIEECVAAGWNSVLFDASNLSFEDNLRQTTEVVALAHRHGVAVEGELEAVKGIEDGLGSDNEGAVVPLDKCVEFVRATKIDSFAPAIGTAHGLYKKAPKINFERVSEIVNAEPIPIVLHGGTGLSAPVFKELIRRGAIKVNISTQLKITYTDTLHNYLNERPTEHDPLKLHHAARKAVQKMAAEYIHLFGSEGKAA